MAALAEASEASIDPNAEASIDPNAEASVDPNAALKEKLNGKWVISYQEGLDAFYRDARKMGWIQRKVLCVTTGVSVEFAFGPEETCTFTMSFVVKSGTAEYTLGTPVVVEEKGEKVETVLKIEGDAVVFSKTFGEGDTVDDFFTLEEEAGGGLELVCRKKHTSGATAVRKFKKAA